MGCLFYPKRIANIFKDKLKYIPTQINASMYKFSLKQMSYLLQWEAFRTLIHDYSERFF